MLPGMRSQAQCPLCMAGPFLLGNLYRHMRRIHKSSEEEINQVKEDFKYTMSLDLEEFACEICGNKYHSKGSLSNHKRKEHGQMRKTIKCPGCESTVVSMVDLVKHCRELHSQEGNSFEIIHEVFDDYSVFTEWLRTQESLTHSKLSKRDGWRRAEGLVESYTCQHSGPPWDEAERERLRNRKRVVRNCTCFVQAFTRRDAVVEVTACFQHYGHPVNTSSLPLHQQDQHLVKSLISMGVPAQTIVSRLRRENWNDETSPRKQPRVCHLTLRDVSNIACRSGLVPGRKDHDDRSSVKKMVTDNENLAAVRLIDEDDPSGDGFLLAFLTTNGKKYLEKYGNKGLVFDDTFNVTRYAFRLATLVVCDDAGHGFPCAHLLSFRMTTAEVRVLFELVKEVVPQFDPQFVMTDDTHVFYNAFSAVFPNSRAAKILCAFHIKKSVERKHKQFLSGDDISTANGLFSRALAERDSALFEIEYAAYIAWLSSVGAVEMIAHLDRYYTPRKKEWAACHRANSPFNTSNHVEAWHNTLKSTLLRRKQNSRIDSLLHVLLQYSNDRHLQLLSACAKGTETSFRRRVNARRHREMVRIYKSVQAHFTKETPNGWSIASTTTDAVRYFLTVASQCDCDEKVNSHCSRCGVCAYQVRCSCRDGCKAGVSCRHAHALMTFVEEARELLRTIPSSTTPVFPCSSSVSRDESSASLSVSRDESSASLSVSRDESSASLNDENDPPECSAHSLSMDGDNADFAKEEFRRLEGVVAVIMESGRAFMRAHRFEDIARMNAELRTFCSTLEIPRPLSRRVELQRDGPSPRARPLETYKRKGA